MAKLILFLLLFILNFFPVLIGGNNLTQFGERLLSGDIFTKEGIEIVQKLLRTESKTEIVARGCGQSFRPATRVYPCR